MDDYLILSNDQKKDIVKSQLKNLQHQRYNFELSILQEQALGRLDTVDLINGQIDELNIKENVLIQELNNLG